jgi:hypothetical protein
VNLEGRLVEVEAHVDHDAVMDSWRRLEAGMAHIHNLLRHLEVGEEGRRPRFANHLEPADVAASVRRGVERIRGWEPTPAERRLAAVAEELAERVTQAEAGLVASTEPSSSALHRPQERADLGVEAVGRLHVELVADPSQHHQSGTGDLVVQLAGDHLQG